MLREIITPVSNKYILNIPENMLNNQIEIVISEVSKRSTNGNNDVLNLIKNTAGILAGKTTNPIEWQQKIRQDWELEI
ncbi:MAG: hypothetical protein RO257_03355 [Candidatus Kapabacteria bacterium]|jgi:hypothetical protein|nr:hypothetical protein [Candidatus Kapabacteria bacterium]